MTPARKPTDADFERAWRELADKPDSDWPSLDVLHRMAARYSLVRARATAIANGIQPDAPPVATPAVHVPKPAPWPPAPQRRRHDATAIDHKLAASGEYAHRDTE